MSLFTPKDYYGSTPTDITPVGNPEDNTLVGIQRRFQPMLATHTQALNNAMAALEKDSGDLGAAAGVQAAQASLTTGYGAVMAILSGLNKAQEKAIQNIA